MNVWCLNSNFQSPTVIVSWLCQDPDLVRQIHLTQKLMDQIEVIGNSRPTSEAHITHDSAGKFKSRQLEDETRTTWGRAFLECIGADYRLGGKTYLLHAHTYPSSRQTYIVLNTNFGRIYSDISRITVNLLRHLMVLTSSHISSIAVSSRRNLPGTCKYSLRTHTTK